MRDALWALSMLVPAVLLCAALASIVGSAFTAEVERTTTFDALVGSLRGARGWQLVSEAQRRVHEAMPEYGLWNGFDTPRMALARGRGICWHRALVLRDVLAAHGIAADPVHSFRNRFEGGLVLGHTWLVVEVDGERKWVCPDRAENVPGVVGFTPLGPVRPYGPLMMVLGWLGSPIVNVPLWALGRMSHGPRVSLSRVARAVLRHPGAVLVWTVVMGWNLALSSRLPPAVFDDAGVPWPVLLLELLGRVVLGAGAFFLVTRADSTASRRGRVLTFVGLVLYLASWAPALSSGTPTMLWCLPYLTPIVWLLGLSVWSRSSGYAVASAVFCSAHAAHGILMTLR